MWARIKTSQEFENNTARERLYSILGLDVEESGSVPPGGVQSQGPELSRTSGNDPVPELINQISAKGTACEPEPTKALAVDNSAEQIPADLTRPEAFSAAIGALAEHLVQDTHEVLTQKLAPLGRQAVSNMFAEIAHPGVTRSTQPDQVAILDDRLVDLSTESNRLVEEQTKVFQEQLAGIVSKTLSQSEATVHSTVSRLEAYFSYAKEIESKIDEKLANLARKAVEAVHSQTKVLEGDLSKIAEQVGCQLNAALEPAGNRIQDYRAQAEEISSALETSLARFTQRAAEAALAQTRLFEESVATISEQSVSQAQQSLQSRMSQSQEIAARSLETELTSLSERLKHFHAGSTQTRLDEIFEASKVKLEMLQQQSGTFSRELLGQMRGESEAIASEFHRRFKSDAEALEAKMVDAIRGRLQKVTEEFRSIFDPIRQDGRDSAQR